MSLIRLESVINSEKDLYYPQTILEECKYDVKNIRRNRRITDELEKSASDESDKSLILNLMMELMMMMMTMMKSILGNLKIKNLMNLKIMSLKSLLKKSKELFKKSN